MEKTYSYIDYDVADDAVEAEKNINTKTENYNQVAFDTKNYLNVRLADGEDSKTIRIRLLPFPDTRTPFLHIHMHTIRVPKEIAESGWKSYVCLEKTDGLDVETLGKKCPFCDVARAAYKEAKSEPDPDKREILKARGKENLSNEFVIMRCIERGKEDEGVKFWKVKIHQDKGDPYNLICTLADTRKKEWLEDMEAQYSYLSHTFCPASSRGLDIQRLALTLGAKAANFEVAALAFPTVAEGADLYQFVGGPNDTLAVTATAKDPELCAKIAFDLGRIIAREGNLNGAGLPAWAVNYDTSSCNKLSNQVADMLGKSTGLVLFGDNFLSADAANTYLDFIAQLFAGDIDAQGFADGLAEAFPVAE